MKRKKNENIANKTLKINYYDEEYELTLKVDAYMHNGNIAIQLFNNDEEYGEELFSTLTVNLNKTEKYYGFIDINNCGNEITSQLEKLGLFEKTGMVSQSGYCTYPFVKFNKELLQEYDRKGIIEYDEIIA